MSGIYSITSKWKLELLLLKTHKHHHQFLKHVNGSPESLNWAYGTERLGVVLVSQIFKSFTKNYQGG